MANANINHSNIDGSREIQELTQSLERLDLSEKDKIKIAKNIQNVFKKKSQCPYSRGYGVWQKHHYPRFV